MKKTRLLAGACFVLVVMGTILFGVGCQRKESDAGTPAPPATAASAEPNSFKEVTAQLDPGGNFYLYLSTEQWVNGLSQKVAGWANLVNEIPDMKAQDREN